MTETIMPIGLCLGCGHAVTSCKCEKAEEKPSDHLCAYCGRVSDWCVCLPQVKDLKDCKENPEPTPVSPLDTQVGGDHYKNLSIQPIEFITRNKLGFIEGCIIKRLCRFNRPGGKGLEDLKKARHELDILIDFEEALF